jgi:Kef-type K+ transport system membrane component KefB
MDKKRIGLKNCMNSQDFVKFSLQIAAMLGCAILFGQLMRRLRQPSILGEMIGGIFLGPTIFGLLAPGLYIWLFQSSPSLDAVRDAVIKLGMLFFLFIAGLEIDLTGLKESGGKALLIGLVGTLGPIVAGVAMVYALPRAFWGKAVQEHYFSFALFIGMNLANSANPVLARILMDLGLLNSGIGTLSMTATIVDDLINWTLFAIILSDISPNSSVVAPSLPLSIGLVILLFVLVLGIGRWLGPRTLYWFKRRLPWPSGFIAVITLFILLTASASEALGVHAFLGAFLIGAALSSHGQEHQEAHDVIMGFALSFFAPIYFVSMGMTTNYIANFDGLLVLVIVAVALVSKLSSVLLGAKLAGMAWDRETWAIGFGLNARGATGIILAGVGRSAGVIDDRIFVAIVVMALLTSMIAGPMMNSLLSHRLAVRATTGEIGGVLK